MFAVDKSEVGVKSLIDEMERQNEATKQSQQSDINRPKE